jgi:hypothetical protein
MFSSGTSIFRKKTFQFWNLAEIIYKRLRNKWSFLLVILILSITFNNVSEIPLKSAFTSFMCVHIFYCALIARAGMNFQNNCWTEMKIPVAVHYFQTYFIQMSKYILYNFLTSVWMRSCTCLLTVHEQFWIYEIRVFTELFKIRTFSLRIAFTVRVQLIHLAQGTAWWVLATDPLSSCPCTITAYSNETLPVTAVFVQKLVQF